jgi:hypothetical protein
MTYSALIIRPGAATLEPIEINRHSDGANHIHELIGAHFSLAFKALSPTGHVLVGYCDDEGAYKQDLGWSMVIGRTLRLEPWPLRGPIVITANNRRGETVGMFRRDLEALELSAPGRFDFAGGGGFLGAIPPCTIDNVPTLNLRKR